MRGKERKKKYVNEKEKNKAKHWRISLYIWSKLITLDSDITIFVQIRLTQQWSSFSRMILWWSDCSASMIVLLQLTSNVKWIVYDEKKSLSKLLRQLDISSYIEISHSTHERIAHISKTSQMAKKWMRLKMCQLLHKDKHHVDQFSIIGHMLIVWAWMLVNELH